MAQLTFFNPDTGENLFEGEGQATVHISRRKWKRLKLMEIMPESKEYLMDR